MGSQMETIKDSEGNKHVVFDKSSLCDDSQMGEQLNDFEILQVLNENNNDNNNIKCFVAKARSLKNHKIYAIKKFEANPSLNNYPQILNKLKELNNPHILKYYKVFNDEYYNIYLIMEFMNNDDIIGFIQAHQVLEKRIKEAEIWNILLQCSSAIDYLHKKNLGNFGIEFNNIFMNNEQNAKITVCINPHTVCINPQNFYQMYDPKDDIYLLGKFFYTMCFFKEKENIDKNSIRNNIVVKVQNQDYSKELMEIIWQMLEENRNKRPDSQTLYKTIKEEYVKKYARNSSINSVLRCLYAFPRLNNIIFNKQNEFEYDNNKYYINYWYLKTIKVLSGRENSNLNECIEEFRRAIASENSQLDGNREIDPIYLLSFLFEKMHKESNKKEGNNQMSMSQSYNYINNSLFNGEEEDTTNKEQMIYKYVTYFNANLNSPISNLFFGCAKTKTICQTCETGNYSFNSFCFVIFDLTKNNDNEDFDIINNGFKFQHNYAKHIDSNGPERIFCKRCLTYQTHAEYNRYYMMTPQLIIGFIRGNKYQNNSNIIFKEELNLEEYVDEKQVSPKNFYLVGSINRITTNNNQEDAFIYFARDPKDSNYWHMTSNEQSGINNDKKILKNGPNDSIINDIKKKGKIIMLFYNQK